jgi:hypothetical protein
MPTAKVGLLPGCFDIFALCEFPSLCLIEDRFCQELGRFLAVKVVPHYRAFAFQCWEVLGCLILNVECGGSVASHFQPSLGMLS